MKVNIEIVGDTSPDPDRLMKAIRETISFWGTTNTEEYTRVGAVEKTTIDITPDHEAADEEGQQG